MLGIELADHTLFQLYGDETPGRKRLLLTAAHEAQDCVRLGFYRSRYAERERAELLREVELTEIRPGTNGEILLRLETSLDADGTLSVELVDESDGHGVSTVFAAGNPNEDHDSLLAGPPLHDEERYAVDGERASRRRVPWLVVAALLLAAVAVLVGILILRPADTSPPVGESTTESGEAPTAEAAPTPTETTETREAPAMTETTEPEEPAESVETVETVPPAASESASVDLEYQITAGDTLWDISAARYGTPWLYPWLAEKNAIRNPDLILIDDILTIPTTPPADESR